MASATMRVRRELLERCLTCSLCKKLFQDATTISECLHTFCRKCIFEKLTDEELECCPMCNIDLGCAPVEKLRPDHNLQDVRAKIFPLRTRKVSSPEVTPSIPLPARRKERSLSSLVVNTPRVATQPGLTGRRTKAFARKASTFRGSSSAADVHIKKEEEDNTDDHQESSSSPEHHSKTSHKRQNTAHAEPSNHLSNKDTGNGMESFVDKAELWQPLNCLVEVANRTKLSKYNLQGSIAKPEQSNSLDNEGNIYKTKVKEHSHNYKVKDEKNTTVNSVKAKKMLGSSRKRAAATRDLYNSAQAVIDASGVRRERGTGPIWFSLVASTGQEGDAVLPQITARYLRIKDGNLPASFIQKYIARKLDLASESEVDITCRGEPVPPSLELHKLVELWLQAGSSKKAKATIGTSAKEFVMIINYARKVPAS